MATKNALLLGATGLVGQAVLRELMDSDDYSHILVVTRRSLQLNVTNRITEIVSSFDTLDQITLPDTIDDVFCCLGTTIKKAGSREAFKKVDYDYVLEAAKLGQRYGAKHFMVVSAIGADASSSIAYNRVKGEMEEALKLFEYASLHIFRPSLLVGDRKEFRLGEKIGEFFLTLFQPAMLGKFRKYRKIHVNKVAASMIRAAQSFEKGLFIHESDAMNSH